MNRRYLKPELKVFKILTEEIIAQSGIISKDSSVDYGGRDEDGFIDPSVNWRNDYYGNLWIWLDD